MKKNTISFNYQQPKITVVKVQTESLLNATSDDVIFVPEEDYWETVTDSSNPPSGDYSTSDDVIGSTGQ